MIRLEDFLYRGKREGYASNKPPITLKDEPGTKVYRYNEESLRSGLEYRLDYEDKYRGYYSFFGTEKVWKDQREAWMMSYSGRMLPGYKRPDFTEKTYSFLREALKNVPRTKPIRGPKRFTLNKDFKDFVYINSIEGDVHFFRGTEIIFFKGKEVYRCNYAGGSILHKD